MKMMSALHFIQQMVVPIEDQLQKEVDYWQVYATGPKHIGRPLNGELKGYYLISQNIFDGDFQQLWNRIRVATEDGQLGYYSAISNEGELIAVHHSVQLGMGSQAHIINTLANLGVDANQLEHRYKVRKTIPFL